MSWKGEALAITIERICLDHAESYHKLLDIVGRERKYFSYFEAPALEKIKNFVSDNLANGSPHFVALAGGELVGSCEIERSNLPVHSHVGSLDMAVLPDYRGKGIGRSLIDAALSDDRRLGLARVGLGVFADNSRAIALYELVGFKREGLLRNGACFDSRFVDTVFMGLVFEFDDPSIGKTISR